MSTLVEWKCHNYELRDVQCLLVRSFSYLILIAREPEGKTMYWNICFDILKKLLAELGREHERM